MDRFARELDAYLTRDDRFADCCPECGGEFDGSEHEDATMCARCEAEAADAADALSSFERADTLPPPAPVGDEGALFTATLAGRVAA